MSRGNVRQAKRYQPASPSQTPEKQEKENNNNNNNKNQNNNSDIEIENSEQQHQQNSSIETKELRISPAAQKILDNLKKVRSARSDYMVLEPDITYRLLFDPLKTKIEKKTFNGIASERIAHTVVNLDEIESDRIPKTLSLTFKQSKPIEEIMEKGYTVMDVTKTGEGFSLIYHVDPIE